ncbi:MAG TPA: hypothetical protein VFH68_04530 [Polyangia bacterium]|nr:hypothetical protein [Polyangia bacterium]
MFAAISLAVGVAVGGSGLGWFGCATSPETRAASLPAAEASAVPMADAPPVVPPPPPRSCEARIGADRLRRSALKRTVDAGLGRWLQTVSVDPLLARGRFKGWIIRSFNPGSPGDSCYAGVDLRTGDVVTRVNGRGVERPEEALEVWTALPASPELVIDFVRDGQPRTMRFGIVDQ